MAEFAAVPMLDAPEPLAILAGGGSLPRIVAAAAQRAGRPVLILGLEGEADDSITSFPHRWLDWGDVGRALAAIRRHQARDVVIVGWISRRPDFRSLKLDRGGRLAKDAIVGIFDGGDNAVLLGAVGLFEKRGFRVVGAHEVARELVAPAGLLTRRPPSDDERRDADLAFEAAKAIGSLDIGQAAAAVNGRVVALEGAEGTDGMLERVGTMRQNRRISWEGRAAPP
ncbi:MAG: LpxI family protein, partial [Alphaproteobacteria bacterium]